MAQQSVLMERLEFIPPNNDIATRERRPSEVLIVVEVEMAVHCYGFCYTCSYKILNTAASTIKGKIRSGCINHSCKSSVPAKG